MDEPATQGSATDIAIIGMSGRFPGARNIAEFWENLRNGVESISFFSDEELDSEGLDAASLRSPGFVKAGGVLEDIDLFDASFFGFNPREAETLDPQQRIFLEGAWSALEDAGYDPESYEGLIGVYAGSATSSYLPNLYSHPELIEMLGDFQIGLGNDKDNLPTSVSYKLNLGGPSIAIQTACSTSLVAACMACQSLLSYQCDMTIAGGIRVALPQSTGYFYQEGGIMSPDGHCRTFDARAQGTVGGNGIGIVVMKRMEDALADGDHIYAVIKGFAINNDGAAKVGYTAPSIEGQAQVTAMALGFAGIEADTITYVEAHGTGTELGDPIEVAALTQAFRGSTDRNGYCAIGSVKTNIGHLDTAAGVAGLIKTVLALKHHTIPPSLNYEHPNPKIEFANSPFYVNAQASEWTTNDIPRRAGVSSFGIGGTNAHMVLEEAPEPSATESSRTQHLLVVSAKSQAAVEAATSNLILHLKEHPDLNLADVAYTLQVGRRAFGHRRAIVCSDIDDAVSAFEQPNRQRILTTPYPATERPVAFMFPGQGSQQINMAGEIYRAERTFREQVDLCSDFLTEHLGLDLREVLFPVPEQSEAAALQLEQTATTQPALFVIEYALARLWMDCGLQPQVMIGHSIGEYVAATLAGVLSLEDALTLVAARGRLMQQMPPGGMLAVSVSEREIEPWLSGELALAAVNGPALCVVSGPIPLITKLQADLATEGHHCQLLHTSHAFHSPMMEPMLAEFAEEVNKITLNPPQIPYVSNVTGAWITAEEATDPSYWVKHLRYTVRFAEGVEQLFKKAELILLEVGPGQAMSTLARQHPKRSPEQLVVASLGHRHDSQSGERFFLNTLGRTWLAGAQVNWTGLHKHETSRRVSLPTYPFERQRFWIDYRSEQDPKPGTSHLRPLEKKQNVSDWFYVQSWKRSAPAELLGRRDLSTGKLSWLVFTDAAGLGARLVERLQQANQEVTVISLGEEFAKLGERVYAINPSRPADYIKLIEELHAAGRAPEMVVHLWSVTADTQASLDADRFDRAQAVGFYSLLFLAQAIGEVSTGREIQISVVSNGMQAVSGEEKLYPEKATLLGPCAVIPKEYANVSTQSIDVVLPAAGLSVPEKLIDQLIAQFSANHPDPVVAYRGDHRWVRTFEAVRINEVAGQSRLKDRGVYLITGGLGGIGLVLAQHLAQTVHARLVLVGRTALPPREDWERWLSLPEEQDPIIRKIRKVQQLEILGAEVIIAAADVADPVAMAAVVRDATERFGEIDGVIHAAGIAGGRIIQLQTPEIADAVLSPKAKGLLTLEAIFKDTKLSFMLLCSSLSAIEGPLGQVDYCSANAFLDAFAQSANSTGDKLVVSVNWDAWQEVGMAVDTVVPRELEEWRQESLKLGILPAEGVEVFGRSLNAGVPQLAVSTTDFQFSVPEITTDDANVDLANESELTAGQPEHVRPELASVYVSPRSETEQTIASIWQQLLGVEKVGIHDNFFELGGHSLLAIQIVSRLRVALQGDVNVQSLFNAPTVAQLALLVEHRSQAELEAEKLEETLKFVEQLSETEIQKLLAAQES